MNEKGTEQECIKKVESKDFSDLITREQQREKL
jgi:hypothetical protein